MSFSLRPPRRLRTPSSSPSPNSSPNPDTNPTPTPNQTTEKAERAANAAAAPVTTKEIVLGLDSVSEAGEAPGGPHPQATNPARSLTRSSADANLQRELKEAKRTERIARARGKLGAERARREAALAQQREVGEAAARARVEAARAQLAAAEVEAAAAAQAEKDAVDASALRQAQARREEAQERLKQSARELALCEDDATALAQSRSEEESRQRQAQARREEAQKRLQQSALGAAPSGTGAPPSPTCGEPPIRRTPSLQPMPLGINRLGSRRRVAIGINDAPSSCGTNPSGRPGLPKKAARTHAQSQAHKWLFDALTTADDHDAPPVLAPEEPPEEPGSPAVEPARSPSRAPRGLAARMRAERLARALGPLSLRRV